MHSDTFHSKIAIITFMRDPARQGLGRELLAEADSRGAVSYLETFSQRNVRFHEQLASGLELGFQNRPHLPNTRLWCIRPDMLREMVL